MLGILLIMLVNLVYLPAVWYGVISDDAVELKTNPFNVKSRKIYGVLLHFAVSMYIYIATGMTQQGLIAALLFSVHPIGVQVGAWGGRFYGLNALLFLAVLSFPLLFPILLLGQLGLGTLVFTPLVFIFTKYWYVSLMSIPIALMSYKAIRGNIKGKVVGGIFSAPLPVDFKANKFQWINLIIAVKTFGFYSLSCLLPMKNGFFNSFLATIDSCQKENKYWYSFNRHFWGGVFAILLMLTIWWFNRLNYIGIGIMLFVSALIPFLNIITVQQWTAPRYAYLPLAGFQIALAGILSHIPTAPQFFIIGGLFVFYIDRLIKVMKHYKTNDTDMFFLESEVFPDNPRLWYYRYEHMLHKGNPVMAWAEASYGLKYLPEDCQLWFGLAVASFELGDMNATLEFLKTCERFMIMTDRKQMQELIEELRARVKLKLAGKWTGKGVIRG